MVRQSLPIPGFFYDDGGNGLYNANQNWSVKFCSENGNPLTFDFNGFKTHYGGPLPPSGSNYLSYDYMSIQFPGISGANWVAYHDDTPQFSFTSPNGCINFSFKSQASSPLHDGWIAEISAIPAPANNDPCNAAVLPVGNVCSPLYFSNKGAFNTTNLGSPPCKTYFGGDVWFRAVVPPSGQLKIETIPGSLTYGIMVLYTGACNSLSYVACVDILNSMPNYTYVGTPGTSVTIRIFGEQAKSGTFGICATDALAPVTGYTGPGGVGDSTSNLLWLRGDKEVLNNSDLVAANGESIARWEDQSGNLNDAAQLSLTNQPLLMSNAIDDMPALVFDGSDDVFQLPLNPLSAPVSVFAVNRFNSSADQTLLSIGDATDNNSFSLSREIDDRFYSFSGIKRYGPIIAGTEARILHSSHSLASPFNNLSVNGSIQTISDYASAISTNGELRIGSDKNNSNFLNGHVGEIIVYNKSLNSAQTLIVNNYLSAKYAINIGALNKYAYQGSHKHDVAGIGRINSANIHSQAQSAGILAIGGSSDLNDNEFLLFGHDGGNISSWSATDVPNDDPNLKRLERTWRVSNSGGNGVGTVNIILSDKPLPAKDAGFIAYNIMVDSDGDFTNGAVSYGMIESGDYFIANNITLNEGDYIGILSVRPFVSFVSASSEGFENIVNPVIEVSLNYAVSKAFEVDYSITGGTASGGGVDYNLNPGKLLFNPGQKSSSIVPLIIDDDLLEIPDEYFTIGLSNPTEGVQIGTISEHSYTILNNDIDITILPIATLGACSSSKDTLRASALGSGPFSFAWSPVAGLSHPGQAVTEVNPLASTKYYLTVTDDNGFTKLDSITVVVDPLPSKPTITPSGLVNILYGDTITLESSPANAYVWSTTDVTQSISVFSPGTYFVKAIDIYGCESINSDTVTVSMGPRPLTVTALPDQEKEYGQADPVLNYSVTGSLLSGDSFSGALTRAPGETVGSYAIEIGSLTAGPDYDITFVSDDFTINPKNLSVSGIIANDKVYDGTTAATLNVAAHVLAGIVGSDDVSLDATAYSANFDTHLPGMNIPVTVTNLSLSGTDAGNYNLIQPLGLSADITPKELIVINALAQDKVYDGTLSALIVGAELSGIVGSEDVILVNHTSGNFAQSDVGTNISVSTSMQLSGSDKDNYILTQPLLSADITAKDLTLTASDQDKVYGNALTGGPGYTAFTAAGLAGSETVGSVTVSYVDGNASNDAVGLYPDAIEIASATGGTFNPLNYVITYEPGDLNVISKTVTITAQDQSKVYGIELVDGLGYTLFDVSGLENGESIGSVSVSYSSGNAPDASVGLYANAIVISNATGGTFNASNYTLSYVAGDLSVIPKEISFTATAADKIYDGNTDVVISDLVLVGVLSGDDVEVDVVTASFNSKDVGENIPVSVTITLKGSDKDNYTVLQPLVLSADISGFSLILSNISANDKVYDGTTAATLNVAAHVLAGIVGSDDVSLDATAYSANFDTHLPGVNIPVTVTNLSLSGADAGNYSLTQPLGLSADITPKELTVINALAQDKEYDGSLLAVIIGAELSGIVGIEDVILVNHTSGNFAQSDVGTNISVSTSMQLSGSDKDNYFLTQPLLSADITAKDLTLTASDQDKVYGSALTGGPAYTAFTAAGLAGSETVGSVTVSYVDGNASNDAVGLYPDAIQIASATGGTFNALNYAIIYHAGDLQVIPKEISFTATAADKVYDGNTDVVINDLVFVGVLSGDDVEVDVVTASFISEDVGNNIPVNVTITLKGSAKDNYTLIQPLVLSADITLRSLTLTDFRADNKVFDGNVDVTGTGFTDDRIVGDDLEFTFDAAFAEIGPGNNITVNFTNIIVSGGADKDNYTLASNSGTALANIYPCTIPAVDITINGDTEFCEGDSVELIAGEAHKYLWSNLETSRSIKGS
jgi:hypothetical protein